MTTHNLCFELETRSIVSLHIPVLLHKIEVQGGILFMDMFSRCGSHKLAYLFFFLKLSLKHGIIGIESNLSKSYCYS